MKWIIYFLVVAVLLSVIIGSLATIWAILPHSAAWFVYGFIAAVMVGLSFSMEYTS